MARTSNVSKVRDRVSEDPGADLVVAAALKRSQQKKAAAASAKKKGRAANRSNKPMHGIDRDLASANSSSRGVDGADALDREADAPTQWKRPSALDAPDPRPGFVQRWVRYRAGNQEDIENIEKAMDQGWSPRERSTVKRGHELTAKTSGQYGKYYVKRGLMLMEMPEKLAQQRARFYRKKLRTMTASVDREMLNDDNSVMPLLRPKRKTRVTVAARRGRLEDKVAAAEDEDDDNDD